MTMKSWMDRHTDSDMWTSWRTDLQTDRPTSLTPKKQYPRRFVAGGGINDDFEPSHMQAAGSDTDHTL